MTSDKTLHLLTHSKITTIKQKYHIFMENNYSFLNKNNLGEKSGILHFFFFFFAKLLNIWLTGRQLDSPIFVCI